MLFVLYDCAKPGVQMLSVRVRDFDGYADRLCAGASVGMVHMVPDPGLSLSALLYLRIVRGHKLRLESAGA